MNDLSVNHKKKRLLSIVEIGIIVSLACVPLFVTFPYRVNIFLSWEGAYRMSQGQIPYKDFGMPLGYMYWVIPAMFFKIFGAQLITLVKAQVFINIISGLAFRSILKGLDVQHGVRLLSVLLYCVSFSFFNFWPWYNHTVIVYEMIGLAFLFTYISKKETQFRWIWLSLSALFIFCSFFTKQDGGGLAFVLCLVLLIYHCVTEKNWKALAIFIASFTIVAFAIIAPLTKYNFGYWFNHGQPPHTARISAFEIIDEFLFSSQWIKFYLLIIAILIYVHYKNRKQFITEKRTTLFLLLTLGILAEASILQVTSYTPPDNNIFFHSFAIAFILYMLAEHVKINFTSWKPLFITSSLILLWWSGVFWKYIQRTASGFFTETTASKTGENVVNRKTYILTSTAEVDTKPWTFSKLNSFYKVSMPEETVNGIERLIAIPVVKQPGVSVLNMTELTPLAAEFPYSLETGPDIPLWHHLGVGMFNKQAEAYEKKITTSQYHLVLFEHIPSLNNFFPFRVRDTLAHYYNKIDSFPAPRRGETQGTIEVYIRKQN
jgi:hypothetical protein